ncbi:hypothetical protein PG993_011877 [Apiospora rasikravindrae]|uniref:Heterokaryon incompatibility domain-containing protein n=1 Tax=Apiospora rasikravindrae TaxID=990691 RepID=A0ABR1S2H9_9PEZI
MCQDTSYTYEPVLPNQIRLLKFSDDENKISAVLQTFSVEAPLPPYLAISYRWASDKTGLANSWAIQIGKMTLPVLDSLYPFFQALRSKGALLDGRWWWIDSLCIDQGNLAERAQQVQLMQYIYRQAQQVIIWLGEESSDSDLAIDFIKLHDKITREGHSIQKLRMILQKEQYHPHWNALLNFLSRDWWSRIWTVQEFVIPSSISFWCGMQNVSRTAVCHSISVADRCTSSGLKETLAFRHGFNRRRAWKLYKTGKYVDLNLSLLALAAYFSCMDATDDRDRLYGLMALSTDRCFLDVSYSPSSEEVYQGFTEAFIARHKSLDIICFASIYVAQPGSFLPSWVPDWRRKDAFLVIPLMVSHSSNTHVGNLRGPRYLEYDPTIYYSASRSRAAVYAFQGPTLLAHGAIIDEVDGLAGSKDSKLVRSSIWDAVPLCNCSDSTYSPTEILKIVCRCLVLDRKDRCLQYPMPTEEFFHDFILLCAMLVAESSPSIPIELQEWFERTRSLQIHGRPFEIILRDSIRANDGLSDSTPNLDEYIQDSFIGRFFDTVVRMALRLMASREGRIGMASERAVKGDLVCILFGCSVPVILRKSELGDSFIFIGECFLDGCMYGILPTTYLFHIPLQLLVSHHTRLTMGLFYSCFRRHCGFATTKKVDFLRLPREIRDQIYEYCLVTENDAYAKALHPWIRPSIHKDLESKPTVGLFGVSKQVRHEAAVVFYSQNLLDFTMVEPDEITGFLKRIGRNAEHIRHLVIMFPTFDSLESQDLGHIAIDPEYVAIRDAIRQGCPNLQTLTTSQWSTYCVVRWQLAAHCAWNWDQPGDRELVKEAFNVADAYLRSFASSLGKLVVELHTESLWRHDPRSQTTGRMREEDMLRHHVRQEIESHGWKIRPTDRSHDEDAPERRMAQIRRESRIFMLSESTLDKHEDEYFRSMF